eukprot:Nitzschia sp. Nitz4//scaffold108_size72880//33102//35126//NITZ4_005815-RA/size72880-processed-gene-0.52-mRNA-1//-1//CDS//3329532669//9398//frame0
MKSAECLRPELARKIHEWLVSFHRLDPRYKILTLFNRVASDGADNIMDDASEEDYYDMDRDSTPTSKQPLSSAQQLLCDAFNATSILTVWRPCSNDAMRKMMEGVGLGKGLDIKGKSAKQGILSAFVPFLQIHEDLDKSMIQPLSVDAKLRVYYPTEQARQTVMDTLKPLARDDAELEDDIIPSKMKKIDKFARKKKYGLELSQRLFWKGYVMQQDISREGDWVTGRPSTPGFQDANNKTLKMALKQNPEPTPLPVVFQHSEEDAMKPQSLVMAYEENGTVTPVVSDFDGFLLGWRREALWFGCNLPREQEDLMMWCVNHIEQILDDKRTHETWTVRWLELLKQEASSGFIPDIPEYGFGDPKSYGIMEHAAKKLIDTGAVRHGSECFNYYFPQEIDDMFLIISDTLAPVPWKYVNVHDLQELLSQKIAEGFVFPLNPKWILCDPGWKKLYDELMESDALYADLSKDVWYPPFSGIREKIEEIHKRHPQGFRPMSKDRNSFLVQGKDNYSPLRENLEKGVIMSGNAAFDLAELELENFTTRKHALARQIQIASMQELPEDDDDDASSGSGQFVSRRTMFRTQRTGPTGITGTTDNGDSDLRRNANMTVEDSTRSIGSHGSGPGSGITLSPMLSKRSMFVAMHSAKGEPRRHFANILPTDATLDAPNLSSSERDN